jgi:putative hydrolase of the HAD superfamily
VSREGLPEGRAIRLLLLDVGNTLAFLDVDAVADVVRTEGHPVDAAILRAAEGRAKRRYEALMASGISHEEGWGLYLATLLEEAGLDPGVARAMIAPLRREHDVFNLWRSVPEGLGAALDRIRAHGVRVAIVSNSEGRLPELLERIGLAHHFERIVDSHHEGVRKPDPEIFLRALARLGASAHETIYLGDIPGVDVAGANAAGIAAVLVDPYEFYPHHPGERVTSVAAWIEGYLANVG